MRVLRFIVDGETIKEDPTCDFRGLFPMRNQNINAEFLFSSEWKNKIKVVAFWSMFGTEYEPQQLNDLNTCIIPSEALDKAAFKIQVLGKRGTKKLITNKLTILQTGDRR